MNKLLNSEAASPVASSVKPVRPAPLLSLFNWLLVLLALCAAILLLLADFLPLSQFHPSISAAPLLLIGAAYLAFQLLTSPGWLDLVKALIVSAAFLLWGVDQLLPPGWFTTLLGDLVIVLYVIDLSWMMSERLRARRLAS